MLDFAKQFGIGEDSVPGIGLVLATVVVQPTTNGGIFLAIAISDPSVLGCRWNSEGTARKSR